MAISFDKKVIHITFQCSPSDNGLAFLTAVQKGIATDRYELEGRITGVKNN